MYEAESILQNLIKEAKCNTIEELKEVERNFQSRKNTFLKSKRLRKNC